MLHFKMYKEGMDWYINGKCYWDSFKIYEDGSLYRTYPVALVATEGSRIIIENLFFASEIEYATVMTTHSFCIMLGKLHEHIESWVNTDDH